jgi:DNA replication protein DnaD
MNATQIAHLTNNWYKSGLQTLANVASVHHTTTRKQRNKRRCKERKSKKYTRRN